jgi:hypothetical protein
MWEFGLLTYDGLWATPEERARPQGYGSVVPPTYDDLYSILIPTVPDSVDLSDLTSIDHDTDIRPFTRRLRAQGPPASARLASDLVLVEFLDSNNRVVTTAADAIETLLLEWPSHRPLPGSYSIEFYTLYTRSLRASALSLLNAVLDAQFTTLMPSFRDGIRVESTCKHTPISYARQPRCHP